MTSSASSALSDYLLHPTIGLLKPVLDYYGPYEGTVTRTQWSHTPGPVYSPWPVSRTYGVIVDINGVIPPKWGSAAGWVSDDGLYDATQLEPPIVQVVTQHQFPTGRWTTTQSEWLNAAPSLVTWAVNFPGRIGLFVNPGLAVDLFYLVLAGEPIGP